MNAQLADAMADCEFDLMAAGDRAGAHMMGEILESYIADEMPDANARIALASGRKRVRESKGSGS